jgi:aspartate aminotransferase
VGAAAALTISLNAILNEGDEVIVIAPYFPEYKVFIEKAKGAVVISESDKNTFKPNLEDLKSKINSKTKAIIINYPNNPTGVVLNENDVISLTNLIKQKERYVGSRAYYYRYTRLACTDNLRRCP